MGQSAPKVRQFAQKSGRIGKMCGPRNPKKCENEFGVARFAIGSRRTRFRIFWGFVNRTFFRSDRIFGQIGGLLERFAPLLAAILGQFKPHFSTPFFSTPFFQPHFFQPHF